MAEFKPHVAVLLLVTNEPMTKLVTNELMTKRPHRVHSRLRAPPKARTLTLHFTKYTALPPCHVAWLTLRAVWHGSPSVPCGMAHPPCHEA